MNADRSPDWSDFGAADVAEKRVDTPALGPALKNSAAPTSDSRPFDPRCNLYAMARRHSVCECAPRSSAIALETSLV